MPHTKSFLLALAALAAVALGALTAYQWRPKPPPVLQSGTLLQSPRPLADFALTDHDGKPFTRERLRGQWSLVFAGFTHCPDVCPATLTVMKLVGQRLQQRGLAVQPVFLSVDPQRDASRLREYVHHFSPAMTGVTGTPAEIDTVCASLGLAYVKVPGAGATDYTIDHSAALVLVNPRAEIAGYFQPPHKVETLATDLAIALGPSS